MARQKPQRSEGEEIALAVHELLRRVRFDDVDEVCCWGVTKTECHVLEVIALDAGLSVNDVAERIRLNKSTASRVVRSLTEKDLVTCKPAPHDRRAMQVSATAKGVTLWRQIVRASAASYEEMLADCTPAERKAVARFLRRLTPASRTHSSPR